MAYEPMSHRRSCLGLIAAPTIATLLFVGGLAVLFPEPRDKLTFIFAEFMFGSILGAYPAAALVGFPIYLLLRGRVRPTLAVCAVVGAIIGLIPAAVWLLIAEPGTIPLALVAGTIGGVVFSLISHRELDGPNRKAEPKPAPPRSPWLRRRRCTATQRRA